MARLMGLEQYGKKLWNTIIGHMSVMRIVQHLLVAVSKRKRQYLRLDRVLAPVILYGSENIRVIGLRSLLG